MKFTEEKAASIAARHNTPAATVKTWRYRGVIPDRYHRENLRKKNTYGDLAAIAKLPEVNAAAIGMKESRIRSAVLAGAPLYLDEIQGIRTAAKKLAASLRKRAGTETGFFALMKDERVHLKNIVSQRMMWRYEKTGKKMNFYPEEITELAKRLIAVAETIERALDA